ncbi:unnamed protein product [Miscanthus lutarioriparius]|uniref:Protein kinase domain-containing protein n=1 Tax=Miscanthus lutarioriparius TaxID=422564 RepID=A0A811RH54_9POAL|nr:unnamed protein product [Miscanthus lutarioriparius]
MIGRGGSAQVFRGNLNDGTPVAVKRINIHGGHTMTGNILLDHDLRAHVCDFGISLSITRGLNSIVDMEHLKGTFGYMASEMLYSVVSDKSDVFRYGMTLLEHVSLIGDVGPHSGLLLIHRT